MAAAYRQPMSSESAKSPVSSSHPHSPWHSPVPYLFGGLAAMLGLIAFALLILACSFWKLSGSLEGNGEGERDLEAGEGKGSDEAQKPPAVYEEKILVIMAGQEKPTFLATPMSSSRPSSLGDNSSSSSSTCSCGRSEKSMDVADTVKQGSGSDQVPSQSRDNEETSDQTH